MNTILTRDNIPDFSLLWLNNLPIPIRASEPSGSCIYVNKTWSEYTGVPEEGKKDEWKNAIHPDDLEKYLIHIKKAVTEGKDSSFELRLKKQNGEYNWFEDLGKSLLDNKGKYVLYISVYTNISEKKKNEELNTLLEGKEVLLREIHHRVKNNMAIVAGMLDLHMDYVNNPKDREVFLACQNRVLSMALIHEKLYRSDTLSRINFKNYIEDLVKKVSGSYAERHSPISVKIEADNTELELEKAMPCGLILNELISNAFKHAFNKSTKGEITIAFYTANNKCNLMVSDDGIGITSEEQLKTSGNLGYTLITALVRQLNGVMEITHEIGLNIKITF
jgi:PAS domain S-box-containing protein